jgi:UPF0042 nucleotide-binding protein
MDIIILSGMSGAGKTRAVSFLEDMGYFCIDNLPPQLLGSLVHTFLQGQGGEGFGIDRLAFVIDVRSAEFLAGAQEALDTLSKQEIKYRIIFLDCSDEVLIRRYKQTRRNHPLGRQMGMAQAISTERSQLSFLRYQADDVIDTSDMDNHDLRNYMYRLLKRADEPDERMSVLLVSFGFKYGIPLECDVMMDVRFIPNPFYNPALRPLCGLDKEVSEDVLRHKETQTYMSMHEEMFKFSLPLYVREGKARLTIGIGCTGGRHRSVAIAEDLARRLRQSNYRVLVSHRDVEKDPHNESKETFDAFE